ncbi:MAG: endonuclease III [Bacteroidales bacterium]|nr:endonuclease III [Bacteroidales bacterium]MCI2121835.1 endonuclease III [Bacteroidales bacterium]MCI2146043.1 endonuclease III [Bacteroidales bacterium]
MNRKYSDILGWFEANVPVAKSELHFDSPFQLITSVILSAQCTDKRVNMVTPALFEAYPTPELMAKATPEELLPYVKSVSYPNSKAVHLVGMAKKLVSDFGGDVPSDTDELMMLPGVGRKTANVVASIAYGKPVIAVDTHVFRVSRRLGLSKGKDVLQVEKDLTENIPERIRPIAHHWLLLHGRYVCTSRKPACDRCGLSAFCDFYNKA